MLEFPAVIDEFKLLIPLSCKKLKIISLRPRINNHNKHRYASSENCHERLYRISKFHSKR